MNDVNVLSKRIIGPKPDTKSWIMNWVKRGCVFKDATDHRFYLLRANRECTELPARLSRLISKYICESVFEDPLHTQTIETLRCIGSQSTKLSRLAPAKSSRIQMLEQSTAFAEPKPFYLRYSA